MLERRDMTGRNQGQMVELTRHSSKVYLLQRFCLPERKKAASRLLVRIYAAVCVSGLPYVSVLLSQQKSTLPPFRQEDEDVFAVVQVSRICFHSTKKSHNSLL